MTLKNPNSELLALLVKSLGEPQKKQCQTAATIDPRTMPLLLKSLGKLKAFCIPPKIEDNTMPHLKVAILDVGHGDFIYATTPLGDNLVIDVGRGEVIPHEFLKNVKSISELQISHPHTDHFDDIIEMSKKEIKSFRCVGLDKFTDKSMGWKPGDNNSIVALRVTKKKLGKDDSAVKCDNNFKHYVYLPPEDTIDYEKPNTVSFVTILAYKGIKILFGGDLPAAGWQGLLKIPEFIKAIEGTKIFKAPHHGRIDGYCEDLFKHISPDLVIISDKGIDASNQNTVATGLYNNKANGMKVEGATEKRKVLTTRNDRSIFIKIDENGNLTVYRDTKWMA